MLIEHKGTALMHLTFRGPCFHHKVKGKWYLKIPLDAVLREDWGGGSSVYVNILLNIHFKHLNRDISGIFSCRAQFTSLSLDQMWHRSSPIEKKPHPQLNKRIPRSDHLFLCPSASTGCTSQTEQHPRTDAGRSRCFKFNLVQDCLSNSHSDI